MLNELYQEIILDHTRTPRNFGALVNPSHQAEGFNPLCGDRIQLFLKVNKNDIIEEIKFQGAGCAISTASASLMTDYLLGKNLSEAKKIFEEFIKLLTQDSDNFPKELGKLLVFSGVKAYPARVKCATLAWHALEAALNHTQALVSTENNAES